VRLAKPCIDVGILTNRGEQQLAFWQREVGLPFEERLPVRRGLVQMRHGMNGSVFKLNVVDAAIPESPLAGYRELWIAREGVTAPRELVDPDGNRVALVPPGHRGVAGIAVVLAVRDAAAHARFYTHALGLERAAPDAFRCGGSLFVVREGAGAPSDASRDGLGYRYTTIQVWDCDTETAGIVARGGALGAGAITLGTTARFSFVRDPDGNWIEISQRASLTGPLPV
jgi:catechol 2,3-dioxygenase-like lactoylglutathione lyase family enzyme